MDNVSECTLWVAQRGSKAENLGIFLLHASPGDSRSNEWVSSEFRITSVTSTAIYNIIILFWKQCIWNMEHTV